MSTCTIIKIEQHDSCRAVAKHSRNSGFMERACAVIRTLLRAIVARVRSCLEDFDQIHRNLLPRNIATCDEIIAICVEVAIHQVRKLP